MRRPGAPVPAILACATLVGCGDPAAAGAVTEAIRALPGVESALPRYESGWDGASRFGLTAVLDQTAVPEQAGAVGRSFTELVNQKGLADSDVSLDVEYLATIEKSTATVSFDDHPDPLLISGLLRDWLGVARSAGVAGVDLVEPESGSAPSRLFRVTVGPAATDGDLRTLVQNHPDLQSAVWVLVGLVDPFDSSPGERDETYEVTGMIPGARLRERWNQIVGKLGAAGTVHASTDTAMSPPTNVTVNIPTSYGDRAVAQAQAWMMFPLLEGLPLPARVEYGGDIFTVGGCTPPDPRHARSELEAELRRKFERC
ncbi:MAG: hypothetical protein ACKOQ4_01410 [Mycobacterium sp.]